MNKSLGLEKIQGAHIHRFKSTYSQLYPSAHCRSNQHEVEMNLREMLSHSLSGSFGSLRITALTPIACVIECSASRQLTRGLNDRTDREPVSKAEFLKLCTQHLCNVSNYWEVCFLVQASRCAKFTRQHTHLNFRWMINKILGFSDATSMRSICRFPLIRSITTPHMWHAMDLYLSQSIFPGRTSCCLCQGLEVLCRVWCGIAAQ